MDIIKALDKNIIESKLNNSKDIIILETISSTNTYAKELANKNHKDVVIVADEQTSGRGRIGRCFVSNRSSGIYLSYLIRPKVLLEDCKLITPMVCVATCLAIEEYINVNAQIKWVNDIYLNNKKVCGILVETKMNKENIYPEYIVIGIGINCYKQNFPGDIKNIVTTIEDETNEKISRNNLIVSIINHIDDYLNSFNKKIFMNEYIKRSFVIGKKVEIKLVNSSYLATVLDVLDDGSIMIQKDTGEIKNLFTGEISRMVIYNE